MLDKQFSGVLKDTHPHFMNNKLRPTGVGGFRETSPSMILWVGQKRPVLACVYAMAR